MIAQKEQNSVLISNSSWL